MIAAFLGGAAGRAILYAALVAGLVASAALALHEHDAHIRAADAATARTVAAAAVAADQVRAIAALQAQHLADTSRISALASTRKAIANASPSTACAGSPAIGLALDGLRHAVAGRGSPASAR